MSKYSVSEFDNNQRRFRFIGEEGAMKVSSRRVFLIGSIAAMSAVSPASQAALSTFNSASPSDNASTRAEWLSATGITTPQYLVDFENGFSNGQNVSGDTFAGGMVITDTTSSSAAVITTGSINGSNPVGEFTLTHNERPYLEFDFSTNPVDYLGFLDIDQAGTTGIVTFVGGGTDGISFETTAVGGDSAEFFGIFRNDMPRIVLVQLDASGDGLWGVDNIEYGVVPIPAALPLLGSALLGLAGLGFAKRKKA